MRRESRGIRLGTLLLILVLFLLGIIGYKYINNNWLEDQETSIQVIDTKNIVAASETKTNTTSTLEEVGSTTLSQSWSQSNQITYQGNQYFYNQLDTYAKTIYQAFENNIENLKTGSYQIEFSNEFDELLKQEDGITMLNDEFQRAWDAFSYDRPDVFYLDPNKFSINVETIRRGFKTSYHVYINNGNYGTYLADGFSSKEEVDEYTKQLTELKQQFVQQMSDMDTDYKRIKALHDWIVDNIDYDSSMTKPHRYNIYGALMERSVVCEGYAKLLKYILDDMGIECVLVSGTAVNSEGQNERHMWNYVKLSGVWYAVDCTWDDPIIIGGGKLTKEAKYRYFLKGSSFYQDHTEEPITDKSDNLTYPNISEQDYE